LKAVMICNFIETMVLVSGGVLLLFFGVKEVGNIQELLQFQNPSGGSMWSLLQPWHHDYGWLPMLTGTIVLGVHGHCTDQNYVQRALAAKNQYHAKMGALLGGFFKILALFIIASPGVVAGKLAAMSVLEVPRPDASYVALLTHVMPVGLLGICLAGLLAAIMSSVNAGLCGCSSLLTYDFFGKIRKNVSDKDMLRDGRIIMAGLLVLCVFLAPMIRHFSGLFSYLLYVWALLAPPVFVCVIFGLFYERSNAKGAFATLVAGCIMGLVAFVLLKFPAAAEFRDSLPIYFQNKLNWGFINTIICTIVMFAVSHSTEHTEIDKKKAEYVRQSRDVEPMSEDETKKYRVFLTALIIVWLVVTVFFSPLGIAK
jgi:SSS family solute:Na+ symporter